MGEIRCRRAEAAGVPALPLLPGQGEVVEQDARGVCVDVGNDRAARFYTRHGAVALGRHWLVWEDVGTVLGGLPSPTEPEQAGLPPLP